MKTYQQIQEEIVALQKRAETAKAKEIADVVSRIKEAIAVYGLTVQDLGLAGARSPAAKTSKSASAKRRGRPASAGKPKYRDEAGNVWGGRGPRPAWLRTALALGKKLEEFAVA
ncbi:MAG: H-NS histone family protein [Pseudomonadota bacterium]